LSFSQSTLSEVLQKNAQYAPKSSYAQEITHSIAVFLAKDIQPFYDVEKTKFQTNDQKAGSKVCVTNKETFLSN